MMPFLDIGAPSGPGSLQGSPAAESLSSKGADEEAGPDEVFEVSRDVFESRLRNMAFVSWDDFKAALTDRPTAQGYTSLRGGSETVINLDPKRVWGWVAVLMLNIFFWGFVGCLGSAAPLQFAASVVYAGALLGALSCDLAKQLSELLRPNLVCTVAAGGLFLARTIHGIIDGDNDAVRVIAGLVLLCSVIPQTMLAGVFMLRLPEDPDRATLLPNLFLGVYGAALSAYIMLVGDIHQWFAGASLLVLGCVSLALAAKLFATPGTLGSVELVSWTLNVGALAVFIGSCILTWVPFTLNVLSWLLFLPAPLFVSLLGAVFGRSFPVVLGACGYIFLVLFLSILVAESLGMYAAFGVFGVLGAAVIFVVQWLPKSGAWVGLVALLKARLAQLCGVAPPGPGCGGRAAASPYFKDTAAGAPPPLPPGQL